MRDTISEEAVNTWLAQNGFVSMAAFDEHLRRATQYHRKCCDTLRSLVKDELECFTKASRLVAEIVPDHQTKDSRSVVEKILRNGETFTLANFASEMDDLVRFRIRCNYLSDVERVVELLRKSEPVQELFDVASSEDRIWEVRLPCDDPEIENCRRKLCLSGVRAHYFVFQSKNPPGVKIEVQVTTLLEHAWDQKDHHLVYEPERKGHQVLDRFRLRVKAASDMLYVADEFFEMLRQEQEGKHKP